MSAQEILDWVRSLLVYIIDMLKDIFGIVDEEQETTQA